MKQIPQSRRLSLGRSNRRRQQLAAQSKFSGRLLRVEQLEDRRLLAVGISISDTSVLEGDATVRSIGALVATGQGGLNDPYAIINGPDGAVYVSTRFDNSILRFNGTTGAPLPAPGKSGAIFVSPGAGGLAQARSISFGPDGNLYAVSTDTDSILRFSASTGASMGALITTGAGGIDAPRGLLFHTDGYLYVTSVGGSSAAPGMDSILRFNAMTGSPAGLSGIPGDAVFVPSGTGGMDNPSEIVAHNGDFYVASTSPGTSNSVLRFAADGTSLGAFVTPGSGGLSGPVDLVFRDDFLYVSSNSNNKILRYDASNGAFVNEVTSAGGLLRPLGLLFDGNGNLLVASGNSDEIRRYGGGVVVSLSAISATPVTVNYTTIDGTAQASSDYVAQSGTVTFAPGQSSQVISLGTRDDNLVESSEVFYVRLSDATGDAVIVDSQAVVSITDDESTRQISINDVSTTEGDQSAHYRGAFVDGLPAGHFNPLTFGPDGNIYTAVGTGVGYNTIQRFDGTTGTFIDTFMKNDNSAHPIDGVRDIVFRDNYVYVASAYTNEVLRYEAATGTFVDVFVTAGAGGINHPDGMFFGPDANNDGIPELYVTGWLSHSVVRYNGATGQPLGSFVTAGSGGLSYPFAMAQRGMELFVTSAGTNRILKYNVNTGAYLGIAASGNSLDNPRGLTFGPDDLMYVSSGNNDRIMRFTPTGAYVDDYVPVGAGGMDDPRTLRFRGADLYVTMTGKNEIMRFGTESEAVFTVSLSQASSFPVTVDFSTAGGTATAGLDFSTTSGTITITFAPGVTSKAIRVPTLDDSNHEANETFFVNLSNSVGGIVVDSQGVATIFDDDLPPTKFYVVNDGSPDRTFEYDAFGEPVENYTINSSGNTSPRGVASNAEGDKVWVADKNRNVYVYNTSGGPLGSWSAGTLANNAAVEGIATNGTDVWIVDSRSDKVYRYSGGVGSGASRLSGSQTAASSFSLNTSNKNSKGIVTDGTYLWVVDDSTTDKVFKYTLNGNLVNSWTIDSANKTPTGLTIDPTGLSQSIWIVDSGTDTVYEYADARGTPSPSLPASATFALASGNTNPQGIADPPPPGSGLVVARPLAVASVSAMAPPLDSIRPNPVADDRWNDNQSKDLPLTDVPAAWLSGLKATSFATTQNPLTLPSESHPLPRAVEIDDTDHVFSLDDPFGPLDESLLGLLAHQR